MLRQSNREDNKIKRMKTLHNPPTGLSQPHKQLGTFRTPFERDFTCNNIMDFTCNLNLSVFDYFLNGKSKQNFADLRWRA